MYLSEREKQSKTYEQAHSRLMGTKRKPRASARERMTELIAKIEEPYGPPKPLRFKAPYDFLPDLEFPKGQWRRIAEEVCAKHQVALIDVISARRERRVVLARHECFYRCKTETTMSLPLIGKRFGKRDHTTVLHGIRMHMSRIGLPLPEARKYHRNRKPKVLREVTDTFDAGVTSFGPTGWSFPQSTPSPLHDAEKR